MASTEEPARSADVVVIGGGIIGCAIAFRLAQSRTRVIVIDRNEPGSEASSAAAGMLAPQGEMVEPSPLFEFCRKSRELYPRFVSEIEEISGQRVGYHPEGTLLVARDDEEAGELEKAFQAQSRLGLPLERLTAEETCRRAPGLSPQIRFGLFVPGDHWIDNEALIRALAEACSRLGTRFVTGSPVRKLNVRNGRVESVEVAAGAGQPPTEVSGGQFVLAAGCWSNQLVEPLRVSLPMQPCRGQIIELSCARDSPFTIRAGHHYLVPRPPGRVVLGTTGEYVGYEKAVTAEGLRSILEGVMRMVPVVKEYQFCRAWAGLRPDTADHLPILGYGTQENLAFATGHFRNGILLAPITAQLITELLLTGSTSESIAPFSSRRFTPPAAGQNLKSQI